MAKSHYDSPRLTSPTGNQREFYGVAEDNHYMRRDWLANTVGKSPAVPVTPDAIASSNAALMEKAVDLIEILGESVATPNEAREILGL